MAEANDVYGSIYQNLIDAGCGTKTTEQCMALVEDGRYCDTLPILTRYRKALPGSVRTGQKQIDCLDFLIYKLKKLYPSGHSQTQASPKRALRDKV